METDKRPLQKKSRIFASRIVKMYKYLCTEHQEFIMSKQLLRSGTSIGANIAESQFAISSGDFLFTVSTLYTL